MSDKKISQTNVFRSIIFSLLHIVFILSFISCDKDVPAEQQDPEDLTEVVITHHSDLYFGDISGTVVDEKSEPLAGVVIHIRGEQIITDDNGYFNLLNIELDAYGTIVEADLENYWSLTKVIVPSKVQKSQTRIMLLPKNDLRIMQADDGGMVNFNEAIKIDFPPNAFTTLDGETYSGEVNISAKYLDPHNENFATMSPGDFRAFNSESELQTLLSLGMAGVELAGSNNEKLELTSGVVAKLFIKVPDDTAVEEVPLWHFDEASGYWIEEGMAQREGDFYVGEVGHFSWWNYDMPFPAVKLSGVVIDGSGSGISGLTVSITIAEQTWNLGEEYTGNRGFFCGWIPAGPDLIIQIHNTCGNVIYEEAIGVFDEDTNLDPITVALENSIELCGALKTCDDELLSDGYVILKHSEETIFIPVDTEGNFCSIVNICESTRFELYGIDVSAGLQGFPVEYDLTDSPINNLELKACDQIASFFSFKIDNEPEVITYDFTISIESDGLLGFSANSEINGVFPTVILDGKNWGSSDFEFNYFNLRIASPTSLVGCDVFFCSAPSVEIIEYGGVGKPIRIRMLGSSDSAQNYLINVSGILE